MYIMQYKCRSKTFDLGCIMSTNLLLFWVCNVFSCVASLWSFTGSSLRCSKTNRYVWTQTLHGSKLYGDFFLHINFKIPCSIKELFGESRFFGFSLLFELMDKNKSDQMSMVFCDYFYSAVFVKKTVTADKNSELWSVPNNVRIQRSHRLAGPDTSLNNPCCCTHAPWLAPCAGERGRSHKSPILDGFWPMSSFFLKISAAFCTWLFVIICWAHVKKTCTHVGK